MTYEFIDDIYNKWPCDDVYMETKDQGRKKIPDQQLQRIMESKETHTLSHMVGVSIIIETVQKFFET